MSLAVEVVAKQAAEEEETANLMTRYKHAELEDDASSVGSVQLAEGVSSTTTHIRYHPGTPICPPQWTAYWKSRSRLERILFSFSAALVTLLIVALLLLFTQRRTTVDTMPCLTPVCVQASANMLRAMDEKTDPCEDFYTYACGGWVAANPIPDGKSMWGTFTKLEQQNQQILKTALEKPYRELKSESEAKAKRYYMSCIDLNETMEALGGKPMLDLLDKIGGWNVTTPKWSTNQAANWSLQTTLHKLHNGLNMGGLFSWSIGEDDRNSSRNVIQIDQGGLTLPTRDNYLNKTENEKVLHAYLEYMTKIGTLLGGEEAGTREQMQAVVDFETRLANITEPPEFRRDEEKLYNLMSLTELNEQAPFIDWVAYFSDAMRLVNRKVTPKTPVVVYAPQYLKNLTDLLNEHTNTTEGRTVLNNYLVWQTVRSLTVALSKAFRDAYRGLRKALIGSEGGEEPWRFCVTDTNNVVGFATGAMFVREVYKSDIRPGAEEMVDMVRNAFKRNLKRLDWMDEETRVAAMQKADAITKMIGYPDYILVATELDKKYEDLKFKEDEYFNNNVELSRFNLRANLKKLDEPVNKTRWSMTPPTVNAFYTPTKNQIAIPYGILQPPFYDTRTQNALNYGAMGVIMGHELTHAFDDQGREYDATGNLHNWWNNQTIDRFKNRTTCLVNQYSAFNVNKKAVNGNLTLGENIADNGGLKAAFHAYETWAVQNPGEQSLPGLNLSQKQLFFVAFAQVWCSASTQEAAKLQLEKDPHAPSKHRVLGPLSNMDEFSKVWQCKPGSAMNPVNKCEVW